MKITAVALVLSGLLGLSASAQTAPQTVAAGKKDCTGADCVVVQGLSREEQRLAKRGRPPENPVKDFVVRAVAACMFDKDGKRIVWKEASKKGVACGVMFYGLDDFDSGGTVSYQPKWLIGIEGPNVAADSREGLEANWEWLAANLKFVYVGAKDDFRAHVLPASEIVKGFDEIAQVALKQSAFVMGAKSHYSYRVLFWREYCEDPVIAEAKGCGEGYDARLFAYRDFLRRSRYAPTEPDGNARE